MPVELKVGPPVLTINQGSTFMVTDQGGEIDPIVSTASSRDTRFVSYYRLFIDGAPWELLSAALNYYVARIQLANPAVRTEGGTIERHDVGLALTRTIGDGIHEDFDVTNYARQPVRFQPKSPCARTSRTSSRSSSISSCAEGGRVRSGMIAPDRPALVTGYKNSDFERRLIYRLRTPAHARVRQRARGLRGGRSTRCIVALLRLLRAHRGRSGARACVRVRSTQGRWDPFRPASV